MVCTLFDTEVIKKINDFQNYVKTGKLKVEKPL